jgi:hypothetical protein
MKTKSTCNFSLKSSALTEMSISLAPWVITVTPICSDLPETTSVTLLSSSADLLAEHLSRPKHGFRFRKTARIGFAASR